MKKRISVLMVVAMLLTMNIVSFAGDPIEPIKTNSVIVTPVDVVEK